jgi:hypothetical protein
MVVVVFGVEHHLLHTDNSNGHKDIVVMQHGVQEHHHVEIVNVVVMVVKASSLCMSSCDSYK